MAGKYRNRRTTIDGITFDSASEAKRWIVLRDREAAGLITDLQRQVSFPLIVNGKKVALYRCDFSYKRDGIECVEDVKSAYTAKDATFRLKAKMFAAHYGFPIYLTFAPDAP